MFGGADSFFGSNDPPPESPEERSLTTRQQGILRALRPRREAQRTAVGRRLLLTNPRGERGIDSGGRARRLGG